MLPTEMLKTLNVNYYRWPTMRHAVRVNWLICGVGVALGVP